MAREKPIPRSKRKDFNRGLKRSRNDDEVKNFSIGLMDIDATIMYYFNNVIKPKKIIKIKANLQPRTEKNIIQSFHTDFPPEWNHKTGIFYVNTCNGYTLFSDGTKVESIENRFVEFDGSIEHTGVTCTDQPSRFVINFNWFES